MGFTDGYKTYDPKKEGYGNPRDWNSSFHERMNTEEAAEYLQDTDPYKVLGVPRDATLSMVQKAFRKLLMQWHPDKNPDQIKLATQKTQKIIAAYTIIKDNFNY